MNRRAGPGFVVMYRWRLHPEMETQFVEAWARVTERLRVPGGSLGSRLHRGSDGVWYGYAQWPSDAVRQAAFSAPGGESDWEQMDAAITERFPEILLESVADYLVLPPESEA